MRVVRIEDAQDATRGVYSTPVGYVIARHHHSGVGWGNLPGPYDEFNMHIRGHEVCCAADPKQFQKWWPQRVLMALSKSTYNHLRVRVLEVRYPKVGRYQTVISRHAAKVVREFSIWEWARMSIAERAEAMQ